MANIKDIFVVFYDNYQLFIKNIKKAYTKEVYALL
jgi:hypothetical protein